MTEALERFDIRLPATAKQMLLQAAALSGSSLTGLVLNAALDKAREIMNSHQQFALDTTEWQRFLESLEQPAEPNERLRAAWQDYHVAGLE